MSRPLHLNDDVYFCVTEGVGVFLDLRRDEYSAITLPPELTAANDVISDADILRAFEAHRLDLLREKLVVEEGSEGGVSSFRRLQRPSSNIFAPDDQRAFGLSGAEGKALRIRPADLLDFFLASRRATRDLKRRHLHDVVSAVRFRKSAAGDGPVDLSAFRREAAIFRKLRPWYPRRYLCLFDALALVEFLARRGLFPNWVFAVQAQPFGAHCWVQAGEYVLNEATEYAREFTPIMVV